MADSATKTPFRSGHTHTHTHTLGGMDDARKGSRRPWDEAVIGNPAGQPELAMLGAESSGKSWDWSIKGFEGHPGASN